MSLRKNALLGSALMEGVFSLLDSYHLSVATEDFDKLVSALLM
jgi:hypothetical protein